MNNEGVGEADKKDGELGVVSVRTQPQFYSPLASYIASQLYSTSVE